MNEQDKLFAMRHSGAHVLAAAVTELYPGVKLGVGPVIDDGFFYDLSLPRAISEEDLAAIEAKMREIVARDDAFRREEMPIEAAIAFFKKAGQDFKVSLLSDLKEKGTTKIRPEEMQDVGGGADMASLYHTGSFVDLCRGPHVAKASEVSDAFKLTKVSGAYWRGDEKNPQMTRVYGVLFASKKELDAYLTMLEEAKKRDHRKLGAELGLFAYSPLVGPGLPLFTPKGASMRRALEEFVWSFNRQYGYERVWIPHLAKADLYKTSGHWDKFQDDIFHVTSKKTDEPFVLKPMNCPHHAQIYASSPRSYRDLPVRFAENTTVYRDENTGQLAGLTRVRCITQDDAHIFCTPEQVKDELTDIAKIVEGFYKAFDMSLSIQLSVHDPEKPEKYLGSPELWQQAEGALEGLLKEMGKAYEVGVGEAAFYGPKIDFMATDAIGRTWQLATAQLDFNQPERFELEYADSDGTKKRPVMVHRAILGSVERFLGVIIEHYAGAFPMWLAPVQVRLASVGEDHVAHAKKLAGDLSEAGIRVEVDASDEKLGKKIRNAALMKVPWTIVVGGKEAEGGDLQAKVFGSEEALAMPQAELVARATDAARMPA
ncbi:threonine--tRNA ligase [Patescibacteria group bacterium]|nr:MAG: threonine--tRNA ligase [Patescibacteria group bacterium]